MIRTDISKKISYDLFGIADLRLFHLASSRMTAFFPTLPQKDFKLAKILSKPFEIAIDSVHRGLVHVSMKRDSFFMGDVCTCLP